MMFVVGQKFTIKVSVSSRIYDMHIIGIEPNGDFRLRCHGSDVAAHANIINYNTPAMNRFIEKNLWEIISNKMPTIFDEELFTI